MGSIRHFIYVIILTFVFTALTFAFTPWVFGQDSVTIVVLKGRDIPPYQMAAEGFAQYFDMKNVHLDFHTFSLGGKTLNNDNSLVEKIRSKKPNLILSMGTQATKLMQSEFKDVLTVFTMVLTPKKAGLNPPGVAMDIPYERRLSQLQQIIPVIKSIGIIYSQATTDTKESLAKACQNRNLSFVAEQAQSQRDLPFALERVLAQVDCFFMIPDKKLYAGKLVEFLLREALKYKTPVIGLSAAYVKAGALLSFDCDYSDLGRQAADMAWAMISQKDSGDSPADGTTQIQSPDTIRHSVNLLVAKRINIKIPPAMLATAQQVIE